MIRLRLAVREVAVVGCRRADVVARGRGGPGGAQEYFGRNKVQYEILRLEDPQVGALRQLLLSAGVDDRPRRRRAWPSAGTRGTRTPSATRSTASRSIFYADHPDFEQTNVIGEQLEEGTGGVTESNRTRVIMPFTGIYADNDHVLGHELVHVFQYNIAEGTPGGGLMRLDALPALAHRRHGRVLLARPRRSAHRDVDARRRACGTSSRRSSS